MEIVWRPLSLVIFSTFLLIMLGVSSSSDYWTFRRTRGRPSEGVSNGLWHTCNKTKTQTLCTEMTGVSVEIKIARGFAILSCLSAVFAVGLSFLALFRVKLHGALISLQLITAGICMFFAMLVYDGKEPSYITPDGEGKRKFFISGWSFVLAGSSVAGCFISSVFGFFTKSH